MWKGGALRAEIVQNWSQNYIKMNELYFGTLSKYLPSLLYKFCNFFVQFLTKGDSNTSY